MTEKEIPFSKSKIGLKLVILGLVIILLIAAISSFELTVINNVIAWAGLLLCSITFFYYMAMMMYKKPGLIINSKGFINNTNYKSSGLIEWNKVKSVETLQFRSNSKKMLIVEIKNNDGKKSSININTALLQSTHNEIKELMQEALK